MNIRKERTHHCGLTNLDFRTKRDADNQQRFQPNLKNSDFGTMGKTGFKRVNSALSFKESLRVTAGLEESREPNPRTESTANFYRDIGKQPRVST